MSNNRNDYSLVTVGTFSADTAVLVCQTQDYFQWFQYFVTMSRTYGHSSDSHFTEIASANIKRSSFNRSHGSKLTCDAGFIVPIFVDEVLPIQ